MLNVDEEVFQRAFERLDAAKCAKLPRKCPTLFQHQSTERINRDIHVIFTASAPVSPWARRAATSCAEYVRWSLELYGRPKEFEDHLKMSQDGL